VDDVTVAAESPVPVTSRNAAAAVGLKIAGASYQEIADTLGFADAVTAREAVERDLAFRASEADPAKREILRATEAGRIDRLLRGVWTKATNPADLEHLSAVRTALRLIDRRIRLYGLDAPTEIVITPTMTEIDAWVAQMVGTARGVQVTEAEIIVVPGEVVDERPPAPA
jgi:hypothetical protein